MAVDTIARALALKAEGGNTPPDLSNYVQFSDFATPDKAGVINSGSNGFSVDASGNTSADVYTSEQYGGLGNNSFISKGTLENAKEQYISSSTTVQNIINSENSDLPKQNAEGTDNTFDDGLESPLYDLSGDGKSEQKTTTGKNKFDTSSLRNRTQTINASTGNIYTLKPNTQYTVSTNMVTSSSDDSTAIIGTPQSANAFIFVSSDTTIETISSNTNGVGTINNISRTLMTDDTGNIFVGIRESASSSLSDLISKGGYVQIEEGPTATSDEPYTGGQPSPSPDYPQEINSIEGSLEFACSGKNLCDGVNQNYYLNNKVNLCGQNVGDSGLAINVSQYSQLTVSTQSIQERYRVGCVDSLSTGSDFSTIPVFNGVNKDGTNDSITVDTTDYNYLIVNATNLSVIQVEEGSVATEIKPYIEPNKVTFNLNDEKLRSVGDVKDELVVDLETGDYYKVENVGEVVFDGSDDEIIIKRIDITIPNTSCFRVENFDYTLIRDLIGMCNYFRYDTEKRNIKDTFRFIKSPGYAIQFCIEDNFASNSDEFRTWLSTHNTIVDYILQTPTTKKLGTLSAEDLAKLKTFKGYNNVTVNTNLGLMNIRFTYGLDIKKYVDNKIAELSAQLIRGE